MAWEGSTRNLRLPKDWPSRRKAVLTRDRHTCRLQFQGCLVKATEVDHISRGDNHSLENLQAVCKDCHKKKTNTEKVSIIASKRKRRFRPGDRHPGLS